jgi:hypothetical protein
MRRRSAAALLCALVWLGMGPSYADERVGRSFWARPGVEQTSVDFYAEASLKTVLPVRTKIRFRIEGVEMGRDPTREEKVYRVRFDAGDIGYIGTGAFEDGLFREPRSEDVLSSTQPAGVIGVHGYIFERKFIFEDDPDEIARRLDVAPRPAQ